MMYEIIKLAIILCVFYHGAEGSHFRGAIIMWKPTTIVGDPLEISITIRVAWRRSFTGAGCDQSTIDNQEEIGPGDLTCFSNCAEFPATIAPFSVKCTDFSINEDWSTGEKTFPFILPNEGPFILGFKGRDWISLLRSTSSAWSLPTFINMTKRTDTGNINSSPRSSLTPIVRLQNGCQHTIKIPVSDPDGDRVRCRWAQGAQECAGVCKAIPAELDQQACEIHYTANGANGWYAVALMVEDFRQDDPHTPLSKIPLQFLVNVFSSNQECSSKPEFVDDTPKQGSCIGVPFGSVWQERIIAKTSGKTASISQIDTVSPSGLKRSTVDSLGSGLYYINASWTPQSDQVKSEFFCYKATDSTGSVSEQLCTSLVAGVEAPLIVANSSSPTEEVLPTQSTWRIQFDKAIIRPSRISTYMNFHDAGGTVVYKADTTSAAAKFPFTNVADYTLEVTTTYKFKEKQEYYITLDRGIVTGLPVSGQCAPESFPIRDPHFWRFRTIEAPLIVANSSSPTEEVLPTQSTWRIQFDKAIIRPSRISTYMNFHDAGGTVVYKADTTSAAAKFPFTNVADYTLEVTTTYKFKEKQEYYITLDRGIVTGLPVSGQCAPESFPIRDPHFWRFRTKDITPPILTFTSTPGYTSGNITITWSFNEPAEDTCSLQWPDDRIDQNVPCNESWTGEDLQEGWYSLFINALDMAGNVASQKVHRWYVDKTAPVVSLQDNVNIVYVNVQNRQIRFSCSEVVCTYRYTLSNGTHQIDSGTLSVSYYNIQNLINNKAYIFTVTPVDRVGNVGLAKTLTVDVDTVAPTISGLVPSVSVQCGDDLSPNNTALGLPVLLDNRDPNPWFNFVDTTGSGCIFVRSWKATDRAGNTASFAQTVTISNPQPPTISVPGSTVVPCSAAKDLSNTAQLIRNTVKIEHPCNRAMTVSFSDSSDPNQCGITFTRTWVVTDDCQNIASTTQVIQILPLILPSYPEIGQVNVDLRETLRWPQYPGATSYKVYVWEFGKDRPVDPAKSTGSRYYTPDTPLPQDTQILWQVEFIIPGAANKPGPVWGFVTRAYPDLVVSDVKIPDTAYSGQKMEVQWTVENKGGASTSALNTVKRWYDRIYIGQTKDIGDARSAARTLQQRVLDAKDGYTSTSTFDLKDAEIGVYYVFVRTDIYNYVRETDTSNNQFTSLSGITIRLTPPPNLKVTSVIRPDATFSGESISVRFTVSNAGSGPTKASSWVDRIFLSKDDKLDNTDDLLSTVYHSGSLQPGEEYTKSQSVYINHRLHGRYHILVATDVTNNIYEHANEDDNVGKHSEAMAITLTPPPDLTVSKIEAPITWKTGEDVAITYTISNEGTGPTFESWWTDKIALINKASGSQILLLSRNVYKKLQGVETYKYTLTYNVLPSLPSGQYLINVTTDFGDRVFEYEYENNNNKTFDITINQELPDLVVDSFEVASFFNVTSGYISINYTVQNTGQGQTYETGWTDQIRIGKGNVFEKSVVVGSKDRNEKLQPNEKYEVNVRFIIPEYIDGSVTVYLVTDYSNRVTETDNNNNREFKSINTPTVLADLTTDMFGIKENLKEVVAGNNLTVYWTVRNKGNKKLAGKTWTDSISLVASDDSGASYKFYDGRISELLTPGAKYEQAHNLTVPLTLTGSYRLALTTNSFKTIIEHNTADNTNSVPLSILSPPTPDLIIQKLSYVYNVETRVLSLSWIAANDGNSMQAATSWVDSVYLSALPGGTSPHRMATFDVKAALLAQQTYDGSATFVVPNNIIGEFYVHVALDAENDVLEINGETNNVGWDQTKLIIRDIKTSEVKITIDSIPPKFVQGQQFNLKYSVQNVGSSATLATSWTDSVYIAGKPGLSVSQLRKEGFKLADVRRTGGLDVNEQYTVSKNITFPYGVYMNDVYIYVVSDEHGNAGLRTAGSNDGAVDNSKTSAIVEVGPLPDLTFIPSTSAFSIVGGEPFSLTINITNIGEGPANLGFYCVLYLSVDAELDPFDVKLNVTLFTNSIDINASSVVGFMGTTPFDQASGIYYFIVALDTRNDVYEISDDNNVAYFVVNMMETVSTDLVLKDVTMAALKWTYNEDVKFDWKLSNNGSVTAVGYKCDTAYMSTNQDWDLLDMQVGKTVCSKINIAPYADNSANDQSVSLADTIPLLIPESYFGLVRTRSNIKDPSLENNVGVTQISPRIDLPILHLDTRKSGISLKSGSSIAYVIPDVPIDETLIILVISQQKDAIHDVYARYEVPATAYQFDAFSLIPLSADQEVTVENTDEGRYFFLVQNNGVKDSTISIEAKLAKFEIRRTSPSQLSNRGLSTVVIEGTLFSENVEAKLKTSYRTINAEKIYRFGSTRLYAQFDMSRFIPGSFLDIYIRDHSTGAESESKKAIRMVYGKSGFLTISTQYPTSLRTFETSKLTINYQNTGDADKIAPLLSVATSGPGVMKIIDEGVSSVIDTQLVLGIPLRGPAGLIPASGFGTLQFEIAQSDTNLETGRMEIAITELPTDQSENIFLSRKQELRPFSMPNEVWDIIWANFKEFTGKTMKTLRNRISEVATSLSLVGRRVVNVSKLINWFIQIADGYLAGDELLRVADIKDEGPISGLTLNLERGYSTVLSKRRRLGPFGYGWINSIMEMEVLTDEGENVLIYNNREDLRYPKGDISLLDVMTSDQRSGKVFKSNNAYAYYKGSFTYIFDGANRKLNMVKHADGSTISVTHSIDGQVKELHHSNGQHIVFTYSSLGLVEEAVMMQVGGTKQTIYYSYDTTEKTLLSVTFGNEVVKYSYNTKKDLTKVSYASGGSMNYEYSTEGYLAKIQGVQPNGIIPEWWEFEYPWNGRAIVKRYPHNEVTEYVYDERRVLLAVLTDGMPAVVTTRSPSKVETIYADQAVITYSHNAKKNIYYTVNANRAITSYALGDHGQMNTFTDPNGNVMMASYDDKARLTALTYPDNTTESFKYNSEGYVKSVNNRNGENINFDYDGTGHMVGKTADGTSKVYNYDNKDRLTSASKPDSNIIVEYDTTGRPTKIQHDATYEIVKNYNERSQLQSIAVGKNYTVEYLYDDHYRLQEIKMVKPKQTSVLRLEYNPSGFVTKRTNGNGAVSTYKYAPSTNWLLEKVNILPDGSISSSYNYTYDRRGRPVLISTHKGDWKLRFDKASQLTYWERPDGKKVKLTYDKNGNRIKTVENGTDYGYEINNLNQYLSYARGGEKMVYDMNGNVIRNEWLNGSFVEYQYDSESKVTGIQNAQSSCAYKYDALENIQEKKCATHTSQFIVDPFGNYGSDIIVEVKDGKPIYYIQGLEHGLAAKIEEGNVYYYQSDGQGSITSILDDSGSVTDEYLYDPFGNVYESRQTTHNEFLFQGQWGVLRQSEVGDVYWMRSRLYDARNGRYLSPDRIGLAGKSTNLYSYAMNNPVMFKDPNGQVVPGIIAAGAIIGAVTNSAIYAITNRGESFSWGGLAGAAVAGGITGAGIVWGAPLATGAALGVTTGVGALGGAAGYATTQALNGQDIDLGTMAYEAAFNGIMANLPRNMVGWRLPSAEFGKYMFFKPSVWRSLFTIPETGPLWATLTLGNGLATLAKYPSDFLRDAWKNWNNLWNGFLEWIQSRDPNDMIGPVGYGDARFVSALQTMEYTIRFENDANATAPAQRVYVTHTLDSDLDIRTFKLGTFGFGDNTKELDFTRAIYQDVLDFTEDQGFVVRVRAGIDVVAGTANWVFQTIDPLTGEQPVDPSIGFLPPNNGTTGQGFVTFSVRIRPKVITGSVINAQASIIFDINEPIETPPIFNTVDSDLPGVNISLSQQYTNSPVVQLNAFDFSSGVKLVDLYVQNDDNTYALLVPSIKEKYAVVPVPMGYTYKFVATGEDYVGNRNTIEEETVFPITFPQVEETSCVSFNNCSNHGNCSVYGFCVCQEAWYGLDCGSTTPSIEPPILEASALPGTEDMPVAITLNARPATGQLQGEALITVINFTAETTFSKGSIQNKTLLLSKDEFGSLLLFPPTHYAGEMVLNIQVTIKNGSQTATREGALIVSIQAKADVPVINTVGKSCYYESQDIAQIQFNAKLNDTDGSEELQVYVNNVPIIYQPFKEDATQVGSSSNRYMLTNSSVMTGIVRFKLSGNFTESSVTVQAVAVERSNMDKSMAETSTVIKKCGGTPSNECATQPCLNGGTCYDELSKYICSCVAGYTGTNCEKVQTTSVASKPIGNTVMILGIYLLLVIYINLS